MDSIRPKYTATIGGHPITAAFAPFPAVCFTLALATDLAFWQTANLMWQNFSSWLLFAGLMVGGLAVLLGALGYVVSRSVRIQSRGFVHGIGYLIMLGLAFVNSLVHAGDGWTAVVPNGLALSAATVFVAIVTSFIGRKTVAIPRDGVRYE